MNRHLSPENTQRPIFWSDEKTWDHLDENGRYRSFPTVVEIDEGVRRQLLEQGIEPYEITDSSPPSHLNSTGLERIDEEYESSQSSLVYKDFKEHETINDNHLSGGQNWYSMDDYNFNELLRSPRPIHYRSISQAQGQRLIELDWVYRSDDQNYHPPPPHPGIHAPGLVDGGSQRFEAIPQNSQSLHSKQQHVEPEKKPMADVGLQEKEDKNLQEEIAKEQAEVAKLKGMIQSHRFKEMDLNQLANDIEGKLNGGKSNLGEISKLQSNALEMYENAKKNLDLANKEYKFMDAIELLLHSQAKRYRWRRDKINMNSFNRYIYNMRNGTRLKKKEETYAKQIGDHEIYTQRKKPTVTPTAASMNRLVSSMKGLWIGTTDHDC